MDVPASAAADLEHEQRGLTLRLLLAGLGAASFTASAVDDLADELARRVGVDASAMRNAFRDLAASWRKEAEQLGDRRDDVSERMLSRMGLVRREEIDDLALRIAQLEHRLRLLERD
jgi:polyhydroxyalkanoate synthesis regulator phasin